MKEFESIEEKNIYVYAINNGNQIRMMYTLCCMTFNEQDTEIIRRLCTRLALPSIYEIDQGKDGSTLGRFTIRNIVQGKYNAFMVELYKQVGENHVTLEEKSIFADEETKDE